MSISLFHVFLSVRPYFHLYISLFLISLWWANAHDYVSTKSQLHFIACISINHVVQRNILFIYIYILIAVCVCLSLSSISFVHTGSNFHSLRFLFFPSRVVYVYWLKWGLICYFTFVEFRLLSLAQHNVIFIVWSCVHMCMCAPPVAVDLSLKYILHIISFIIIIRLEIQQQPLHQKAISAGGGWEKRARGGDCYSGSLCKWCVSCSISMLQLGCKDLWQKKHIHLKLSKIENRKMEMLMKFKVKKAKENIIKNVVQFFTFELPFELPKWFMILILHFRN